VRVRDHVALSTAGAAVLYPWFGRRVLRAWVASILIDSDHYVWFAVRHRNLNPVAAVRFFHEELAPEHPATRLLHSPVALAMAFLMSARRRTLLPVALGMAAHVALDRYHEARLEEARAAALQRDDHTCQVCGSQEPTIGVHLERQPWLLPSYHADHLVTLCARCHDAAHRGRSRTARRAPRAVVSARAHSAGSRR
jgi:hypothetical protein